MLKKVIILVLILVFIFPFAILFIKLEEFHKLTKEAQASVSYCKQKYEYTKIPPIGFTVDDDGCFDKMYQLLLPEILIYKAKYKEKMLDEYSSEDNFSIPKSITSSSEAFLSWGLGHKANFERHISEKYHIPVYAFDCSNTEKEISNFYSEFKDKNIIHIQRECLGTDKYLGFDGRYDQKSSGKVHTFEQKLKELNLEDKKISIKLGIPEMLLYIDDILKYKDNILYITMQVNLNSATFVAEEIELAKKLNKDFILIARYHSGNILEQEDYKINYFDSIVNRRISLLYVNKNILDDYYIPLNQEYDSISIKKEMKFPKNKIDSIVVIYKKLRDFKYNLIH